MIAASTLQNTASKDTLIRELQNFMPFDTQEKQDVRETLAFLQTTPEPECFLRTHLAGHVTASALLISADCKKALLTHHAFLNQWLQFGGHTDGSADIAEAALRETVEESGIAEVRLLVPSIVDVDIQEIPDRPERNEPVHLHYDIRYLMQAKKEEFTVTNESKDLRWFTMEQLLAMDLQPSVIRMAKKWKKYCDDNNITL